ncbi:MAG: Rieske (2Fe-2S) protein [Dehalococcoidia bacterium]
MERWVRAGSLSALIRAGCVVTAPAGHTVALLLHEDRVHAIDNRCPHMGFPLSQGSVEDGLLTCHWHHARFDLASGGTLDPFADDVRAYPVRVEGDDIFVDVAARGADVTYWQRRLNDGMEQGLTLVVAKAILALRAAGVADAEIAGLAGTYGLRYRAAGWGSGMTILTALTNVLPHLDEDDRALALLHGVTRAAQDCAGQPPRFQVDPLPDSALPLERLVAWFRRSVDVRDEEGAERVLRTAIADDAPLPALLNMLYAAATDHQFIDGGHTIDFITKAAEYLDHAGAMANADTLSSLVRGLCHAERSEESYSWRFPINLPALIEPASAGVTAAWGGHGNADVRDLDGLVEALLGDQPQAAVQALVDEFFAGGSPLAIGQAVAYAAALRLARFPVSNEFGDWDTVHNTWSSCQALYRALQRAPSPELFRGVFQAAMALYLDRFLNVPPARLPDEAAGRAIEAAGKTAEGLLAQLDELFSRQQQVDAAARIVNDYLVGDYADDRLLAMLGHLVLREDAGFHMYQTLEAGTRLYLSLRERYPRQARRVLVGVVRFLAAHSPTARAMNQTARIALRLHRGEELYAEPEPAVM